MNASVLQQNVMNASKESFPKFSVTNMDKEKFIDIDF